MQIPQKIKLAVYFFLGVVASIPMVLIFKANPPNLRAIEATIAKIPPGQCYDPNLVSKVINNKSWGERLYPAVYLILGIHKWTRAARDVRFGAPLQWYAVDEATIELAKIQRFPVEQLKGKIPSVIYDRFHSITRVAIPEPNAPKVGPNSDPALLFQAGLAAVYGFNRAQDKPLGVELIKQAALRGYPPALKELGLFYSPYSPVLNVEPTKAIVLTMMASACGNT